MAILGFKDKDCIENIVEKSEIVNSLPNDKILEVTKLKGFADNKLNIANVTITLFNRVENTAEKEKMLVSGSVFYSIIDRNHHFSSV